MKIHQAYRFALDPTPAQRRALASHVGAARVAFNRMLAEVKATLEARHWERRLLGGCITEAQGWSLAALRRRWNEIKHAEFPWWPEVSKEAFNSGLEGLSRLATVAAPDGAIVMEVDNPRPVQHAQAKLRRLGRKAARQQRGSKRWRRTQGRIGAAHARAAQVRRDALAKLTTTLACRHEVIVVEHLRAKNLARRKPGAGKGGRALNRALGDAALAEVRRLLGYKTTWYGSTLVEADPFYPSSRSSSACGGRKPSLRLAERAWTCPSCGAAHDRDRNAATNLARLGEHQSRHAGSGPVAGRRADRKTPPNGAGGADPSTPQSDAGHQTGTATSQEEAA